MQRRLRCTGVPLRKRAAGCRQANRLEFGAQRETIAHRQDAERDACVCDQIRIELAENLGVLVLRIWIGHPPLPQHIVKGDDPPGRTNCRAGKAQVKWQSATKATASMSVSLRYTSALGI